MKSLLFAASLLIAVPLMAAEESFDLVIYGGTPAGLISAVSAARENAEITIAVIEPSPWIGGMVAGGLSRTDKGNVKTIGGMVREYFTLAKAIGGEETPLWYAEPRHNLEAFRRLMAPHTDQISLTTGQKLTNVVKQGNRITTVRLQDGSKISGNLFVDASYEGDLMARAGVGYLVGRESRSTYGEPLAGYTPMPIRPHGPETMAAVCSCLGGSAPHFIHGTPIAIPALDRDDQPIAGVNWADPDVKPGDADGLTQAYNFRLCVTQREDLLVPFPEPANFDPDRYQLLLRLIQSYPTVKFGRLVHLGQIANGKYDLNAQGLFSTDYAGGNVDYPDGDYATREEIFQDHVDYVQGFLWFLGHDLRVPAELRDEVNSWGLCSDEFVDNDHWPYALYVREARRMIGQYVMKQQDTWTDIVKPDSVAMGSFILDCHIVQRIVTPEGTVTDEGSFQDSPARPYQIPYRSLLPKRDQCENLTVPVCLSASHIAYCSIRMEPVYMALGEATGVAAGLTAKSDNPAFADVDIEQLRTILQQRKAVLELEGLADLITVDQLPGIAIDDRDAVFTGSWSHSGFGNPVEGSAAHDGNAGKGSKSALFAIDLAEPGTYEVRLAYTSSSNRASAAPVTVTHADGVAELTVDQRSEPEHDGIFTTLGTWTFSDQLPAKIEISNRDTDSYVSVDAVVLIPIVK